MFGEEGSVPAVVPDGTADAVHRQHAYGLAGTGGVERVVAGEGAAVALGDLTGPRSGEPAVGNADGLTHRGDGVGSGAVPAVRAAHHAAHRAGTPHHAHAGDRLDRAAGV